MDNLIGYFQNMKTEEMVLFITIALSLIVLIIMSVSLASKNAELRKIIVKLSKEKENDGLKEFTNDTFVNLKEENVSEKELKSIDKIDTKDNKQHFVLGREPLKKENHLENTGLYTKNILNEVGTRDQTSPIVIGKKVYPDEVQEEEEVVQKLRPIEILEEEENDREEERESHSFVEEISKQIEKDLEPQTIDLTEFERRQEEDAVISYEELIKNKTRSSRYVDEEELLKEEDFENTYQLDTDDDEEFLKELKSFRNDL